MRLLQFSTLDAAGGAARIAMDLHRGAREQGHLVRMVVKEGRSGDPDVYELDSDLLRGRWARACARLAERLTPLAGRGLGATTVGSALRFAIGQPARWWRIRRGQEDFDYPGTLQATLLDGAWPDVVHCHNLHGSYFDLRALPCIASHAPTVVTLHDEWTYTGHCAHALDCLGWTLGCGRCPDLTRWPAIARDDTARNLRSKESIWKQSSVIVVTPSRWLLDRARRSVLAHAAAWSVAIPNGVDLSVFAPGDRLLARRALGIPDDAYVLLFVAHGGAANPYKDGATMEDAVRRIAARQPTGRRLLLLAVGGDPTRPVADLEHVTYVPYQSDQRALARYYRSADVYLHAAHADTFPTSVLEALACGTPVVATAVGGIPEQVRDGETGLLTPRGSPDAMASAAARLLQDADLRHAMSCAAVADARARFGLRRMLGDYLSLYERAIEEFRSRATAVPQYAFAARERSACGAKE